MKPLLIVDGYNVIGAWKEAAEHGWSMDESRDRLLRMLEDHAGYVGEDVVLVFDGYMSDRRTRSEDIYGAVTLVFTMKDETADSYIERLVAKTPKYRQVRVATNDGLEQSQVLATGAIRMTARELLIELKHARSTGQAVMEREKTHNLRNPIAGRLSPETLATLEKMRRG